MYASPEITPYQAFFTIKLCRTSKGRDGFPAAADGKNPGDFSRIRYCPGFEPDYLKDATCRIWSVELRTDQNGDPYVFVLMNYMAASKSFLDCPLSSSRGGTLHLAIMPGDLKQLKEIEYERTQTLR